MDQNLNDEMNASFSNSSIKIYPDRADTVSDFLSSKYEREARKYWDQFYKRHENRFFKDRHYLHNEWGAYLISSKQKEDCMDDVSDLDENRPNEKRIILEIGCGVGNSIFPILEKDKNVFVHACDFSQRAVDLVKVHENYDENRVNVFVCDLTCDPLTHNIPPSSVDTVTMLFVLSAISPSKMPEVIRNVVTVLRPNGRILFRDYAVGDLAQNRLNGKVQKICENFYVRGDGTRSFFFSESFLKDLFEREGGLCTQSCELYIRDIQNRAKNLNMHRRWIQGVFYLPEEGEKEYLKPISNENDIDENDNDNNNDNDENGKREMGKREEEEEKEKEEKGTKETNHGVHLYESSNDVKTKYKETVKTKEVMEKCMIMGEKEVEGEERKEEMKTQTIRKEEESVKGEGKEKGEKENEEEIDLSDSITTDMFMLSPMYEMQEIEINNLRIHATCQPHENQHMQKSTGLLLWESSKKLSKLIHRNRTLTEAKTVLELGCGCTALVSLFASVWSKAVIATDGDASSLHLLASNFKINSQTFPLDKIKARRLVWGDSDDIHLIKQSESNGFDLILGADVVYVHEAVPRLFQTARELLAQRTSLFGSVLAPSLLVLCHVTRRVGERDIITEAVKARLGGGMVYLSRILGDALDSGGEDANFVGGLKDDSSIRVMCFVLNDDDVNGL